jgi:hypothetical protein
MVDIVRFARNIRSVASKIDNGSVEVVKLASKKVLHDLCYGSPADKGVMRSNYRVSIGGTNRAVLPAYAPGKKLGMGEVGNASAAYAVGAAKIDGLAGGSKLDKSIKISNAVPYLDKVNGGSVKQTAAGFVERAVFNGAQVVKQFKFFGTSREEEE